MKQKFIVYLCICLGMLSLYGCGIKQNAAESVTEDDTEAVIETVTEPAEQDNTSENQNVQTSEVEETVDSQENQEPELLTETETAKVELIEMKDNDETGADINAPDYIFPESGSRLLTEDDVKGKAFYELRRGINEIYARNGRIFSNGGQDAYFRSKSWYQGTILPLDFSDEYLSECEAENIRFLQEKINKVTQGKNYSSEEKAADNFLHERGINGILNNRFDSVEDGHIDIGDIVYQLSEGNVDYDALCDAIEKQDGYSIETDVTYCTGEALDAFLKKVTGYGLKEAKWEIGCGYVEELDTYYLQHGDTNYMVFESELIDFSDTEVTLLLYQEYSLSEDPVYATLYKTGSGYRFKSIK